WARIEPQLPTGLQGPGRVDDRRVISGIVHMLQCVARWRVGQGDYAPYTTIYNRFNRWSRAGRWQVVFAALVKEPPQPQPLALDSTSVYAHRFAAGGKGGRQTKPSGASS